MELTREQLKKIQSTINFLIVNYEEFADYGDELILTDEDIEGFVKEGGYELPSFPFPGEQEDIDISVEEFLEIADEIPTIKTEDHSIIKTKHLRYYIVEAIDSNYDHIISTTLGAFSTKKDNINIDLVSDNFIIGLAATALGEYDKNYYGTFSPYLAVELKYNTDEVLNKEEEFNLVKSYIFEVADSTGIAVTFSEIKNPLYDYEDLQDEEGEYNFSKLRDIEPYNEGMKLFISALQIQEAELRFLNFYKILEHFAPVAVNIEAHELMRKKMDAPKKQFENGDFIRSIFDLAKSMRAKFNDEDLIKSTFINCFDFIGLFDRLPEKIKSKVKKQINLQIIDYSINKQSLTTAANMVGKIIYSTRNKVVHAKSNYEITDNECDSADLETLNEFMKEACSQSIRWYNRQPQHLKLSVIQ